MRVLLQRAGLLVAGLAVTLLLAEGLTRLLSDMHPPLFARDPLIGAHYTPNLDVEIRVPESGHLVRLRFNDVGFRGPTRPRTKTPGTCRIAVIGDSQIAAIATREEDTLVRRLEARLHETRPEARWEVMNFGVSGSSTGQELALYRELVADFDSDLVVLAYFEANDLVDNSDRLSWTARIYMDLDESGRLVKKPYSVARASSSTWLNQNSRFYVWQKDLVNRAMHKLLDDRRLNVRGGVGRTFDTGSDPDLAHAWRLTEALLRTFDEEVRSGGAEFLLLYVPSPESVDPRVWERHYGDEAEAAGFSATHTRRQVEAIAENHHIDSTFLSDLFASKLARDEGPLFFQGEGHMNEVAQDLAARQILEHLEGTGALARLSARCAHTRAER